MKLYGRDEELACLRLALREAVPGDAWITIVGGPGIGKRALVEKALLNQTTCWIDASRTDVASIERKLIEWEAARVACVVLEGLDAWIYEDVAKLADALERTSMSVVALATRPFGLATETQLRLGPLSREASAQMLGDGLVRAGGEPIPWVDLVEAASRIQGLPAAIAVAIPRLALLGLEYTPDVRIADGLEQSFDRWLAPRTDSEKRSVRMLALFEAGLALRDVERVLDIGAEDLHTLASNCLLRRDKSGGRVELFPWLRSYALTHFVADEDAEERTLMAFLERAPCGGDLRRAFAANEFNNLVAFTEHRSPAVSVAALSKLRWAWLARLQLDEGVERTSRVMERLEVGTVLWLQALLIRLPLQYGKGDPAALEDARLARVWAARLQQPSLEGAASVWELLMSVGDDTPGASERAARCHAEFSRLLDPYYLARLSAVRGLIAIRDRQGQSARGFFRQAAHDTLKDGDNWLSSDAWAQCAWLAVSGGNVKEARFALGEAQRCEKRASQGRPQITRVCAEAAVLVMERCAKDVDELVETALVHLGLRAVSTTQSVSSVSLGFLHGVRGIARFIEADLDGAGRCFEEALANCEQRPAVSSYWLFWLALAQASLGANVTAEDTFHSALEMNRLAPEWPDETNALAAIFGARVLGAGSACVVGMNAAAAVHSLQAQLSAGHGTGEARLALIALGHDDAAAVTLSVSEDVRAFEVTGTNATLASGSPQRAVLRSLLEAHDRQPGTPMSTDELIAAAWPGETLVGDSGPNRLRVAISRLRKLGLGDLIVSHPGGYALVQGLIVEVRPSEGTHGMQRVMRCN